MPSLHCDEPECLRPARCPCIFCNKNLCDIHGPFDLILDGGDRIVMRGILITVCSTCRLKSSIEDMIRCSPLHKAAWERFQVASRAGSVPA